MKNLKNCPKIVFDSSKEASWCTEPNAKKNSFPNKVWFLKKSWINLLKLPFLAQTAKIVILAFFPNYFRNRTMLGYEVFCVAFSASTRFFWAIKNSFWTIFQIFHHKVIWGGGPKVTRQEKKVEQNFWKKFLTRGQNGTRKRVGRSRVWRIPFFDWIQISNIIWFSPNNKDRILFSIEKIQIPNTICYQENPNPNTNSTYQSNYLNTEH